MVGILDKIRKKKDKEEVSEGREEEAVKEKPLSVSSEPQEEKKVESPGQVRDIAKPPKEQKRDRKEEAVEKAKPEEQKKAGFFKRIQRKDKETKEEEKKKRPTQKLSPEYKAQLTSILIAPRVTEKTMRQTADENVYAFDVILNATKLDVKRAVEALYSVSVERVRMLRKKPDPRRQGTIKGSTSQKKRAMVRLAKGDRIDFFEQAE